MTDLDMYFLNCSCIVICYRKNVISKIVAKLIISVKKTVIAPKLEAVSNPKRTFLDLPEVEIPITTSFCFTNALPAVQRLNRNHNHYQWLLAQMYQLLMPMRERNTVCFNLLTNSAAICWLSAALPPFPNKTTFPSFCKLLLIAVAHLPIF